MKTAALARVVAAAAAAVLLVATIAAPVLAHAALVTSDPVDGAILDASPTTITLTFDDDLSADKSNFTLVGPSASSMTGAVTPGNIKVMTAKGVALDPGTWTVQWTAFSTDGHLTRGTVKFTISAPTPAPTAAPTAAPAATATAAATVAPVLTPAPTAAATPAPSAAPVDANGAADSGSVIIAVVAGLAFVAGAGWLLIRRGRRS